MAYVLDAGTTMVCPHGGQVTAVPATTSVRLSGQPPLLPTDVFTVAACPFMIGNTPSPCVRVTWSNPAARVRVEGTNPLLSTSLGLCVSAAGAPQGSAIVSGFQTKVSAQ